MFRNPRTIEAVLMLLGTIVGAGMFGIPYVFAVAGFLTGISVLGILTAAVVVVHLAYAEVVLRTNTYHALPGYAGRYLGKRAGILASLIYPVGLSGSLLAYLLLGGSFLQEMLRSVWPVLPQGLGVWIFYALGAAVIARGLRVEGKINSFLTAGLVFLIILLAFFLAPEASGRSLAEFHLGRWFVPYGVVLFSLYGASAVPEIIKLAGQRSGRRLLKIILSGTLGAAFLYVVFAASVAGALGEAVEPDFISGFAARFGPGLALIMSAIGFFAAITSFIPLSEVLGMFLRDDLGLRPRAALALVIIVPGILYFLGFKNFIAVVSIIGALAIGTEAIFILLMQPSALRNGNRESAFTFALPGFLRVILILLFGAGVVSVFI